MHPYLRWLALCLLTVAARGASDDLLFVRNGQVRLWRAGEAESVVAIAPDPGWVYALPTWMDDHRFLVMRLKGGQAERSHVGIVERTDRLAVKPAEITWLPAAGGAYTIGVCPEQRLLAFLKIAHLGEEKFEVYLTVGGMESEWGDSQRVARYGLGDVGHPSKRLRFTRDGRYVSVPGFPTDVSATVDLFDRQAGKMASPLWLDYDWMAAQNAAPEVSCADWGGGNLVALGTLTRGLFLCDPVQKKVKGVDVWEMGTAGIHELCVAPDNKTVYYEVERYQDNRSTKEIRAYTAQGTKTILTNAESPDVRPAGGEG